VTLTVGDDVADDTELPALEDLIRLRLGDRFEITENFDAGLHFDPAIRLPGWSSDLVLKACAKYAARNSGAGVEERWLMGTVTKFVYNTAADDPKTYRKRAFGLWRFLHIQRALSRLTLLQDSDYWESIQASFKDGELKVLLAENLTFDGLDAFLEVLPKAEDILRYATERAQLELRRLKVVTHEDWPSVAQYMLRHLSDLLEQRDASAQRPDYLSRLKAAIEVAERTLQKWDSGPELFVGQPPTRRRPGSSRAETRARAAEKRGQPPSARLSSSGSVKESRDRRRRGLANVEAPYVGANAAARGPYFGTPCGPAAP
jgi:hypothetical protein